MEACACASRAEAEAESRAGSWVRGSTPSIGPPLPPEVTPSPPTPKDRCWTAWPDKEITLVNPFIKIKKESEVELKNFFFLVCLSLTRMLRSNLAKAPSFFADPSNEGYNCNKTWHPLPNYYRTDVLRPSTFRWFGGLLSLLITAHWAEILGLSRLKVTVLLV